MNQDVLRGKSCLLTGATGGLGRHLAAAFAERGCHLFLTGRDTSGLDRLKREIESSMGADARVYCEPADLQVSDDVDRIIESAGRSMGGVDILINSAGAFPIMSLAESSLRDFDFCFDLNVRAPFQLMRAFAPGMAAARWGRILNIGSSSAYDGFRDTSLYCSSKHALLGLSRALHDELKEHNIRVFCLSPGSMKTGMGRLVRNQTWDTFIEPREVAAYAVFLVSLDGEMVSPEVRLGRMVVA